MAVFGVVLNVLLARGQFGTIYIRADGSIDPPTAPISTSDSVTYIFTDNIYDSIVVERSNIAIDGNGHTLQGTGSGRGFFLNWVDNVTIQQTNIRSFETGIRIGAEYASGIRVIGNNITYNSYGIWVYFSAFNTIYGNNIVAQTFAGILLHGSYHNNISRNFFVDDGLLVSWHSSHNIVENNVVNGKPLVYLEDNSDLVIEDAGQVILVNCSNIIVMNLNLSQTIAGVQLWHSNNSTIKGNNITAKEGLISRGIVLYYSSGNNITGNKITNNREGIELSDSSNNNSVSGNNITNSSSGISVFSSNNRIIGNRVTNNGEGIVLHSYSNNNSVSGNNITNNVVGIGSSQSSNNNITGNNITNNVEGVVLSSSSDNNVIGNNITANNQSGIHLDSSSNNSISGNNMTNNGHFGIYLGSSLGNKFYHNNFINNTYHVDSDGSINVWDDGYPSGGNNWSGYSGVDVNRGPDQDQLGSDEIGDASYTIDANNRDLYPLMKPWPSGPGLHELQVTLRAPKRLALGGSSLLEATVTNNGIYDEKNVTLSLIFNHTVINSTTVSQLEVDSYRTINYLWTPTVEGQFNLTAYATPVTGEPYIENNQKTTFAAVSPPTVHNINTGLGYLTIQEAINASETSYGHTIKVDAGKYYENILVYKGISLIGENMSNTIIDGNRTGTVVYVTASNVIIQGFTIRNSGIYVPYSGLHLRYVQNCRITNNTLIDNRVGIWLEYSSNNIIYHNNFINNAAAQAAVSQGYVNTWDDGYRSGGNYWSSYIGVDEKSGPNQDQLGSDGIGDTQYFIYANSWDRFPLMHPWPSEPSIHELQATLKTPIRLPLGGSILLEATVWNYGFSNEQDVTFYLTVNGTVVNSTTISLLKSSSSYTINYLWTPTVEGRVNITAYAIPVPSEIYVANNRRTSFVTVSSKPPIQNVNTGLYYDTIQQAIDATETLDGHTIRVEAGTYYEHVTISKSLRIIGEDRTYTIIDGSKTGTYVVQITVNNVVLSGFTVQNSNAAPTPAIRIDSSNNVINNNTIINNGWGIYAFSVSNNTISNNIITTNVYGIDLEWVTTHTITNNTIANHQQAGIYLRESRNNIFTNNKIRNNKDGIVLISYSNKNKFYHNNIIDNTSPGFTVNSDANTWDNGYPSGGNYWSNYVGIDVKSGPNQDQPRSDGIGDTSHTFSGANQDKYPLMNPIGTPQPPIANFTHTPEQPIKGAVVNFDSLTSYDRDGFITNYEWDFGDGDTAIVNTPTITHVYAAADTYIVNLIVTDNDGLRYSIIKSITVVTDSTPPTTIHGYDDLWHTTDFTITLTATDDLGSVAETYYIINDGPTKNVSTDGQPLITTEGANNKLEYWSKDKAGNEENHHILAGIKLDKTAPIANAGNNQTASEDTLVTFDGSASADENGIQSYTWTFTDSTLQTLSGKSPTYTFATPGTYTVTLEVADLAGNTATDTITITVIDVTDPEANAGSDRTVNEDISTTLDGSASTDNVGITGYTWTFTDGTVKTLAGDRPAYTFSNPGVFTITLNVTDAAGNWATDTVVITVLDVTKPIARAGQDQTVNMGEAVIFDAGGSTDNVGIVSYEWNFGDGTTGIGKTTTHTYANPGTYTVTLTVKDAAGNTASDSATITVLSAVVDVTKPVADAGSDRSVNEDSQITLDGSASSDNIAIATYTWTFTDSARAKTLNGEKPTYTFNTPGVYTITLNVTDAAGNWATDTVTIAVLLDTDSDGTPDITDPDDDNDGMPDSWETQNGLDALNAADASQDPDGDGLTNLQEYQESTNPNTSDTQPFPMWTIAAAVVAIIGIAAIATLLLRKRK